MSSANASAVGKEFGFGPLLALLLLLLLLLCSWQSKLLLVELPSAVLPVVVLLALALRPRLKVNLSNTLAVVKQSVE